jgi:hypothetical protein
MSFPVIQKFEPTCQCEHCKSYRTIITYTSPQKRQRGHRCHECGRTFRSTMLDLPEREPSEEAIRDAIERAKSETNDRKGYWTRVGRFIRVKDGRARNENTVAVYRCDLCQKTSLLTRQQFSDRKLCDCQSFDPDSPCDQFRKATGKSVSAAAKANGVPPSAALLRIRKGWDMKRAVTEPVRLKKKKGES